MRICNFIEEGRYGGPQARITLVAEALKQFGIETHVAFSMYDSDKFRARLDERNVDNSPLAITRLSKEKKTLIRYILFFFKDIFVLYAFFKKNRFDLIHINGSPQIKGAVAAKIVGIPVIWHLNDTNQPYIIRKMFSFIAGCCASGFIVAGQKVFNYYLQGTALTKKLVVEIHAPVDENLFDPNRVTGVHKLISVKGFRILTICNIDPSKGLDYFVEMASLLNQQYENLAFLIGGPVYRSQDQYFYQLKETIKTHRINNITFLGRVDDVPAVLQAADIFVFSSLAEASPTVIWETMAMGKGIVTTDVGSVRQYIEGGVSGFIVPIKDPESLAEKAKILIEDPELRERMGSQARKVAVARLTVTRAAEKHSKFYRRILSHCKKD